jgi:hypothetical protein
MLVAVAFSERAHATLVFQDDLDGPEGTDIVLFDPPDYNGTGWVEGGSATTTDDFLFAEAGGVEDAAPNLVIENLSVSSMLETAFDFSSLLPGEVLHFRVTAMQGAGMAIG